MKVIQQPERARACGSGAKSSADRRPVDPPPIVELRVYEGEGTQAQNDITFSYSANFFLFATLENARNMAQGRNSAGPSSFPVLTGTPVAGMAYLDRPTQAGYFIFPDLSVRHEGKYRLSFALFEELKDQKDMDAQAPTSPDVVNTPLGAHVSHRLEVKSAPFTVFSAKKFPGLTESTALSRMVAEQGCRVRIRRDVRMRRRDNKASKEWENYEEESAYERARRTATPDTYARPISTPQGLMNDGERPRSVSNASNASFTMPPQRRPSIQDIPQGYQQGYQTQMQVPQQQNGYSPIAYGTPPPAHQYQTQYAPQQPMMQPPQTPYQAPHPAYQAQPAIPNGQNYGYMPHSQAYSQPSYESTMAVRHDDYTAVHGDYRRHAPPHSQSPPYHAPVQMQAPYAMEAYSRPLQPAHTSQPISHSLPAQHNALSTSPNQIINGTSLAPLKTLHPHDKHEPTSPSYGVPGPIPASEPLQNGSISKYSGAPPQSTGTKRSYGSTFGNGHADQPLRQGARPPSPNGQDLTNGSYDGSDGEDFVPDRASMSYRRADGTQRSRRVPLSS
jgi:hypothetical protein